MQQRTWPLCEVSMRVFKYRGGSDVTLKRDIRSLVRNEVYLSPIDKLNDPFETRVEIHGKTFEIGKILSLIPGFKYNLEFKEFEKNLITSLQEFIERSRTFGVYSLSETPIDELLWAYYSNSHIGFCVEYELDALLEYKMESEKVIEVKYESSIPLITMEDMLDMKNGNDGLITKLVATKSKNWEHEKEVRVVTGQTGLYEYDYRSLKGIYFGHRCSNKTITLIMRVLKGRGISYYQVQPLDGSYKLEHQEIEDPYKDTVPYRKRLAPVSEGVPYIDEKLKPYEDLINKAIEIARREPYCEIVYDAYISGDKGTKENPVFFVNYERSDGKCRNFYISKNEIQSREHV